MDLAALADDQRVLAGDLAAEAAVDADRVLEGELALERRTLIDESGQASGGSGRRRRAGDVFQRHIGVLPFSSAKSHDALLLTRLFSRCPRAGSAEPGANLRPKLGSARFSKKTVGRGPWPTVCRR